MSEPQLSEIKAMFRYEPETGFLRRLTNGRGHRTRIGDVAGYKTLNGYILVKVGNRGYLAHQIAWFLCTGVWPISQLDHVNRDKADNRIANLRLASQSQNVSNTAKLNGCISRHKGVTFRGGSFTARIKKNGISHHLGSFKTEEEASVAYVEAARKLHGPFACIESSPVFK